MKAGIVVSSLILLATTPLPVKAAEEAAAAIPYNCVDSTVTKTGYYFEGKPESGIYAEFETKIGVETASDYKARVVDRSSPLNSVMDAQEVGDKVQVCLISFPETDRRCNPKKISVVGFIAFTTIGSKLLTVGLMRTICVVAHS